MQQGPLAGSLPVHYSSLQVLLDSILQKGDRIRHDLLLIQAS